MYLLTLWFINLKIPVTIGAIRTNPKNETLIISCLHILPINNIALSKLLNISNIFLPPFVYFKLFTFLFYYNMGQLTCQRH